YASGVSLVIGQNATGNWLLGFSSPAFHLTPRETFPIDLTFDGQAQFHVFGTVDTAELVTAVLPNTAAEQLKRAHLMAAVAKGTTFQFNLDSTGKLLSVVANCVAKIKSGGIANAGDFSILPAPKAPAKSVAQNAPSAPSAPKPAKTIDVTGTG